MMKKYIKWIDYEKLWKKFKLFLFHLWYGKDAFHLILGDNFFKKRDVITYGKGHLIMLSNGKKVSNYYEYVVKKDIKYEKTIS